MYSKPTPVRRLLPARLPRLAPQAWRGHLALSDRLMLAAIVASVALAGWRSLAALLPLASGDTPLSFVPLVPVVGLAFLFKRFDPAAIRSRAHDPFVDGIFFTLLFLGSATLLLVLPTLMSWDYWLDRLDVPGVLLLLAALIVLAWGLPALLRLGPALLYMLLAWPLPLLIADNHVVPGVTDLTAAAARALASLLPGIAPDPGNPYGLLASYHGQVSHLTVAQACAGINSALGLVIVALPLALLGRGSWEARLGWLLLGAVLSWSFNVLRILSLGLAAAVFGPAAALDLLHPVAGILLFVASFALLLALAPRCRLDVAAPWRRRVAPATRAPETAPHWGLRRLSLMLLVVVTAALAESNLRQFGWLTESALPLVELGRPGDLFHPPPGWHLTAANTVTGWEPFFGPSTISAVLTVASPGLAPVGVQAILTRDLGSFNTYGVENCYTFHGFQLQAVHRLALGNGVVGTLVDFRVAGSPAASLYWIQPVRTPQGLFHQRIVLIADQSGSAARVRRLTALTRPAPGVVQPVQDVATAIAEFLSPWMGGNGGPSYDASNAELRNLGQAVIAHERPVSG